MITWIKEKNGKIGSIRTTGDDVQLGSDWRVVPNDFGGNHCDLLTWFDETGRRIPDTKLVETGKRKDNRGRWYHTERTGETKLVYQLDEDPGNEWTRKAPLENEPHQKWDEASGSWVVDTKKKETADLESKIGALKSEISSRDWKVIKAQRLERPVDDLYPGETAWYNQTVEKINDYEAQLNELKEAAGA
jgi:hypothetical protein